MAAGLRRRLVLLAGSTVLSLVLAELGLRWVLAQDGPLGAGLRDPARFADSLTDDDFWKLKHRWDPTYRTLRETHPLLGWTKLADERQLHDDAAKVGARRPVLLYGDSFAACTRGTRCFEDFLNEDPEFSAGHYLLNYGVGGFGVGQILLMLQTTVDLFDDPLVVFSLMTDDLDRSVLSVRKGQKPYFLPVDGAAVLHGLPIEPDPARFLAEHPPELNSYLWNLLVHWEGLPEGLGAFLRGDAAKRRHKLAVNRAILTRAVGELRARGLDFMVLVFHPAWELQYPDWRSAFVDEVLAELEVPHLVSSLELLRARYDPLPIDDLIQAKNRHPTALYNEHVAEAIAAWVRERD